MRRKIAAALMLEKDKIRGPVAAVKYGIRDKVYGQYLDAINPRGNDDIQQALAASPDPRYREFLERILMPRYRKVSVQTIAKACNIDLKEFQDWWNKESTSVAIAMAQTGSVDIVKDMVRDAKSIDAECNRCEGLGFIGAPGNLPDNANIPGYRQIDFSREPKWIRTCPACKGTMIQRRPGDSHARDKIMQISGMVQNGKPAVQIVQNFGGATQSTALANLDEIMTIDITKEE